MAMLPPQRGIGFDSKIFSERSLKSRIHAGSFFISEIAATIFAFKPFSALNTACDGVMKSYLLISPTPVSSGAEIKSVAIILVLLFQQQRTQRAQTKPITNCSLCSSCLVVQ